MVNNTQLVLFTDGTPTRDVSTNIETKAKNLMADFTSNHNYEINLFIYNAAQYVKDIKS